MGSLSSAAPKLKVCAVSFLNTVPLVWGLLHGRQRGVFDLSFAFPSACADRVGDGSADIGIVPVAEIPRLDLEVAHGSGIACHGPVRSILLIAKRPIHEIQTLAADTSSRTSVQLARVVLERKYGVHPILLPRAPSLEAMIEEADAALIIGDPALRLDPARLPYEVLDLGGEWVEMTGLPMVFAAWAGRPAVITDGVARAFVDSCRFGMQNLDGIVAAESEARGFSPALVRDYLTNHIVCELGERDYAGMRLFLDYAGLAGHPKFAGVLSA